MNHFAYQLLCLIGRIATSYPRTWINSFAFIGVAIGIAMHGAIGSCIGGLFGAPTTGMWVGYAIYAWWFANNVDLFVVKCEHQIAMLKAMR